MTDAQFAEILEGLGNQIEVLAYSNNELGPLSTELII